jgi:hypothetical protein
MTLPLAIAIAFTYRHLLSAMGFLLLIGVAG